MSTLLHRRAAALLAVLLGLGGAWFLPSDAAMADEVNIVADTEVGDPNPLAEGEGLVEPGEPTEAIESEDPDAPEEPSAPEEPGELDETGDVSETAPPLRSSVPFRAAAQSTTPLLSISGKMEGQPTADGSNGGNAICVEQDAYSMQLADLAVYPSYLTVDIPSNEYLLLTINIDPDWVNIYSYAWFQPGYKPFSPMIRLGNLSTVTGVTNRYAMDDFYFGFDATTGAVNSIETQILVVPQGMATPGGYSGVSVINVPSSGLATLSVQIGIYSANDLGASSRMPSSSLTITGQTFSGATSSSTGVLDTTSSVTTSIPGADREWDSAFPVRCVDVAYTPPVEPAPPVPPAVAPNATLSKAFDTDAMQPGGSARLTFTITNADDGTATGDWSFTDTFPSQLINAADADSTLTLVLDETDPDVTSTCQNEPTISAEPGSSTFSASGQLASDEPSCTISVLVTTTHDAALLTNHPEYFYRNSGYFPLDLTNTVDTSVSGTATGLDGVASATLRVEIPSLKVDISTATVSYNDDGSITASWIVTVLNGSNMDASGNFAEADDVSIIGAHIIASLGDGLADPNWLVTAGTTADDGSWELPELAPGQALQATLSAQVTDRTQVVSTTPGVLATGLQAQVLGVFAESESNPNVTLLANEADNDDARNSSLVAWVADPWAIEHGVTIADGFDFSRVASVEADTDRWDQSVTPPLDLGSWLVLPFAGGPGDADAGKSPVTWIIACICLAAAGVLVYLSVRSEPSTARAAARRAMGIR